MSQFLNKKICLIGEFGVGKTSLIRRFVYDRFDDSYLTTLGVKVSEKLTPPVQNDGKFKQYRFMIWDIAGTESGKVEHESYWTGASGALMVTDLTRSETFGFVRSLMNRFLSVAGAVPVALIGNKTDLIAPVELDKLRDQLIAIGDDLNAPCIYTSAKTGDQVEACFLQLAGMMKG